MEKTMVYGVEVEAENLLTIFSPNSSLGGYEYRVKSDGRRAFIQECNPGSAQFRTLKIMTNAEFNSLYDANGHILTDPSWLNKFAHA